MEFFILLPLLFAPLAFAGVEPWAVAVLQITAFSSVVVLLMREGSHYRNILSVTLIPAVLAVVFLGLCQAISENPINAPYRLLFTAWRPDTLNSVLLWLFYAAVLFSVPQIIKTPAQFRRLLWAVFALGVTLAILGMFQKTGDNTRIYGLRFVKGVTFGPFVNKNHAATFLIMAAMTGGGLFLSGLRQLFMRRGNARFFDLLAIQCMSGLMLCIVLFGVIKTESRGGLLSLVLAAAVIAFVLISMTKRGSYRSIAFLSVFLILAAAGTFFYHHRIFLGIKNGVLVHSVTLRLEMYRSGLAMLKDFPFFGIGLGAVEHAFPYYQRENYGFVRHVHSDWLELFLQTGLAGGLIYLAGFFAALRGFFRIWLGKPSFTAKLRYGGVLGGVLAASLHDLVDFGSQMPANALLFYVLIGALASRPATENVNSGCASETGNEPPPLKKPLALGLATLSVLGIVLAVPQVIGWWYDFRAKGAPYETRVPLREAALRWTPSPRYAFRLGADYFNRALKSGPEAYDMLGKSLISVGRFQLRAPVNPDLATLKNNLLAALAVLGPSPQPGGTPDQPPGDRPLSSP